MKWINKFACKSTYLFKDGSKKYMGSRIVAFRFVIYISIQFLGRNS